MTLCVTVGVLANCVAEGDEEGIASFSDLFAQVNEALRQAGEEEHHEPTDLGDKKVWYCTMFTSDLWGLRRLAAYLHQQVIATDEPLEHVEEWPPPSDPDVAPSADNDAVLAAHYEATWDLWDHLFYHSDCEGFYVPVEMYDVLVPPDELYEAVGGIIGSSQGLLADCEHIAGLIGLPLDLDPKGKAFRDTVKRLGQTGADGWWRYPRECETLLKLHKASQKSLELGAAIVFQG